MKYKHNICFLLSRYYDIMLLIWSKSWNYVYWLLLFLKRIKFGQTQISVLKIDSQMSKTVCTNFCLYEREDHTLQKSKPKILKAKPYFYFTKDLNYSATLWKPPPIQSYTMHAPPFYFLPNPPPFALSNGKNLPLSLKIANFSQILTLVNLAKTCEIAKVSFTNVSYFKAIWVPILTKKLKQGSLSLLQSSRYLKNVKCLCCRP